MISYVPSFELFALAKARGGFTFSCHNGCVVGNQPGCRKITGCGVAIEGRECRLRMPKDQEAMAEIHRHAVERMIDAYVLANGDALSQDDCYLGGWVNEGYLFLDCVVVVAERSLAMLLGQQWKQIAIYDFENDKSVPVHQEDVDAAVEAAHQEQCDCAREFSR